MGKDCSFDCGEFRTQFLPKWGISGALIVFIKSTQKVVDGKNVPSLMTKQFRPKSVTKFLARKLISSPTQQSVPAENDPGINCLIQ